MAAYTPIPRAGDRIRATQLDCIIEGIISDDGEHVLYAETTINDLHLRGFKIEVTARAKPEDRLPKAPGIYATVDNVLGFPLVYVLDNYGTWHYGAENRTPADQAHGIGPGTRLKRIAGL